MAAGTARQEMEVEGRMKRAVQTACATDNRFRAVAVTRSNAVQQVPTVSIESSAISPEEEGRLVEHLFSDEPPMFGVDDATETTPRTFKFVLRGPSQAERFLTFVRELRSANANPATPSA